MAKKDYYAVLEIKKDASEDEIKRAYRRQSLRWHPDKNPDNQEEASAKFKELSEAYQILSDVGKKRIYDAGSDPTDSATFGGQREQSFHFTDATDVFRSFFGGRNPFSMFDDDDFFGGGFGSSFGSFGRQRSATASASNLQRTRSGAHRGGSMRSPLDDSLFGSPFGEDFFSGSGFGSFGSPKGRPGASGSMTRMTSTTTRVINGKRVTTKVTKTRHADGTEESNEETYEEGGTSGSALPTTAPRTRTALPSFHATHGSPLTSPTHRSHGHSGQASAHPASPQQGNQHGRLPTAASAAAHFATHGASASAPLATTVRRDQHRPAHMHANHPSSPVANRGRPVVV